MMLDDSPLLRRGLIRRPATKEKKREESGKELKKEITERKEVAQVRAAIVPWNFPQWISELAEFGPLRQKKSDFRRRLAVSQERVSRRDL